MVLGIAIRGRGRDPVSEMQASWAGVLWLIPPIQRQHAALILARSRDPADVARATSLWVRGGGRSPKELIDAYEGFLTEKAVADLLLAQLHEGRSVPERSAWLETCHALWGEMPESLVSNLVNAYEGPPSGLRPHDHGAADLSLFGKLLIRSTSAVDKALAFEEWQLALLARVLPVSLLEEVDRTLLKVCLEAAVSVSDEDQGEWASVGWPVLARIWELLAESERESLREAVSSRLPSTAIPQIAISARDLVRRETIHKILKSETKELRQEIANAHRGHFTGWASEPTTNVARLLRALGRAETDAVDALVDMAIEPRATPAQRQAALAALENPGTRAACRAASGSSGLRPIPSIGLDD